MLTLPPEFEKQISSFSSLFSKKVFKHAKVLLLGAVLTTGKRTVSSALRAVGLSQEKAYHKYHRVLSMAKWSCLSLSKRLLVLILKQFVPSDEPIVLGIDETLERRRGKRIKAKGIYRDGVRSSKNQLVKSSGLRWISVMVLTKLSWTKRVWALPFFTLLAPSQRYNEQRNRKHKTITDWAYLMIRIIKRWLADRKLILVADSSYAVIEFLYQVRNQASLICPLRMDAQLFDFVPPRPKGKRGRHRKKGKRQAKLKDRLVDKNTTWIKIIVTQWYKHTNVELLVTTGTSLWYNSNYGKNPVPLRWVIIKDPNGKIESKALLSTDLNLTAEQIIGYYIQRWSVEVTFQELRKHLGVETQRQWSALAIARTTPLLMGVFSLITLWANYLYQQNLLTVQTSAWYHKTNLTFSDAIAAVRQYIWGTQYFKTSILDKDILYFDPNILKLIIQLATHVV